MSRGLVSYDTSPRDYCYEPAMTASRPAEAADNGTAGHQSDRQSGMRRRGQSISTRISALVIFMIWLMGR